MAALTIDTTAVRRRFSSLQSGFAFLDAPGGSQVPDSVGEVNSSSGCLCLPAIAAGCVRFIPPVPR